MANINLLPWRETHLKVKNNVFAGICGICVVICISTIYFIGEKLKKDTIKESSDINYMKQQILSLEDQIKEIKGLQEQKDLLLARRDVIESLQASRPFIVKLFDNIVRATPNGLYMINLVRKGNNLSISGYSESNTRISVFMRNLERLSWVANAHLTEIKQYEETETTPSRVGFTLEVLFMQER